MTDDIPITKQQRNMKYQIWLMMAIVVLSLLVGFLLIPKDENQKQRLISLVGTTNQGSLVSPTVNLDELLVFDTELEKPKWTVLIVGGVCGSRCKEVLKETKHVHMLLGKNSLRVHRVYMQEQSIFNSAKISNLQDDHPHLSIVPGNIEALRLATETATSAWDAEETRVFVLTPDNEAVLYYSVDHDLGGLLDDLKHLLKYSPNR
ncbi:MAG: hypothetical protein CMK30_07390 [Porticoccaceae bacterium]|nr:hypothetical protein [Porticoccaceae bacterium]|tara:strand:+ start:28561 stop:29175 length:615 start_codon:yes stop_codon:yes gene_type:complete